MNRKRSEEEGIREKSMQYKIHVGDSLHPFTLSQQYGKGRMYINTLLLTHWLGGPT